MNLISQILENKRRNSTSALIPFITAGYPNIDTTLDVLYTLDIQGADVIELGIPYSDSLADGPTIQKASKVALDKGTNIDEVLVLLDKVKFNLSTPIVIFTYYNPILARGIDRFIKEIVECDVKGLIIPDLPIEETDYISHLCASYGIELILFIAPTSSKHRIMNILQKAPGCVYIVSSTGVTGARQDLNNYVHSLSTYIRSHTSKLLMLGFGISSVDQVSKVCHWDIDGIVVGSAFINILANDISHKERVNKLGVFCRNMKDAIK